MTFEVFSSRVLVSGFVEAQTGLHIGTSASSLDPGITDNRVIRDAAGQPFIPGSSFKGSLRAHIERVLRALGAPSEDLRKKWKCCDPLSEPCMSPDIYKKIRDETTEECEKDGETDHARFDKLLTTRILSESCRVCKLFGSNYLSSHALIRDLFVDPDSWANRIEVRDGVGIDRDTETARSSIKYDFEVVPASTRFNFDIAVENADPDVLGLLALGLLEMERGRVPLGGKATRGLGGVKLCVQRVEVVGPDDALSGLQGEGSQDLIDYLLTGSGRKLADPECNDYLKLKATALFGKPKS